MADRLSSLDRAATRSDNAIYATILLLLISGWAFLAGPIDWRTMLAITTGSLVWALFQLWFESRKTAGA